MHLLLVRAERPEDGPAIAAVNRRAFGREDEARIVAAVRASDGFIPELSMVAERDGTVVGHAMFSRATICDGDQHWRVLVLGPVAVLPELQRQGIGSAMIQEGLAAARAASHRVVVLLGHPTYYPRFGFEPSARHGIQQPFKVGDASMALFLDPAARGTVRGVVVWPPAFGVGSAGIVS